MKKINFLFLITLLLFCGCENKNIDPEKLKICCEAYDGKIENEQCISDGEHFNISYVNECLNEPENLKYGQSTIEGQKRRICCMDSGGSIINEGAECSTDYEDSLNECLDDLGLN